jgi:hypothetical protein
MSVGRADARRIALSQVELGLDVDGVVETKHGWYFPSLPDGRVGSSGSIVGKADGAVFTLGSAYPVDRDIHFYDRGFRSDRYDLVILDVFDEAAATSMVRRIGPTVIEPSYEGGTVWRIPRPLTEAEIVHRLATLPCVFADVVLYFSLEVLEQAEREHAFSFDAVPRTRRWPP